MSWKIPESCDVCGDPLLPGQSFYGHSRLGATWHGHHPLLTTRIKGEDVSTHTLFHGVVPEPAPVTLATYEPERLAALLRLLVDEGHLTPYGRLQIERVVQEPPQSPPP